MQQSSRQGRRSFVWKAGAAMSATIGAVCAGSSEGALALSDADALKARLARLEDVNAIRQLHEEHARLLKDRDGVILQKHAHQQDVIEIASDRLTATARFHCIVHAEAAIAPACPLVDMARQQGGGVIKWTEAGVFENVYAREREAWKIRTLAYHVE